MLLNDPNNYTQPQAPSPQSANISGPQPLNNLPYFLQPDPSQPAVPPPSQIKKKKPWFLIGVVGLLVVMIIFAVVVVLVSHKKSVTSTASTNQVTLTSRSIDAISFAYPSSWQQIDATRLGFTLGYASGSTYAQSVASIYYKKTSIMPVTDVASVTEAVRQSIRAAAISGIEAQSTTTNGCTGFTLGTQTNLATTTYFGVDVTYACSKNAQGVGTEETDRFLYIGDGNLYQIAVVANQTYVQQNKQLIQTLSQQAIPKD